MSFIFQALARGLAAQRRGRLVEQQRALENARLDRSTNLQDLTYQLAAQREQREQSQDDFVRQGRANTTLRNRVSAAYYRNRYPDLAGLSDEDAVTEGRNRSRVKFEATVPQRPRAPGSGPNEDTPSQRRAADVVVQREAKRIADANRAERARRIAVNTGLSPEQRQHAIESLRAQDEEIRNEAVREAAETAGQRGLISPAQLQRYRSLYHGRTAAPGTGTGDQSSAGSLPAAVAGAASTVGGAMLGSAGHAVTEGTGDILGRSDEELVNMATDALSEAGALVNRQSISNTLSTLGLPPERIQTIASHLRP